MRATVLLNRGAAGAANDGPEPAEIVRALAAHGVAAEIEALTGDRIAEAARRAAGEADVVVAAGGDGTVSAVAGALAGTGTPLGVIPLGTFNNFAGDLGVPDDLDGAAQVIATGRRRRLDLAEVNGHSMLNNSALGVYAQAVRRRRRAGSRLAKALSTVAALLPGLRRPPALDLTLEGDGFSCRRTTPLVFVGNNEYRMNLFSFGARPRLDDGQLFVYLMGSNGRAALLRLLLLYLLKDVGEDQAVERFATSALTVRCDRPQLDVFIDGEVHRLAMPVVYSVRPGAQTVIAPPPEATAAG